MDEAPVHEHGACEACLSTAGFAHAAHPLRRMVLGPLPVELVSSAALLDIAKEHNVDPRVDAQGRRSKELSSPLMASRRRRGFAGITPIPWMPSTTGRPSSSTLRRVMSTGSIADAAAEPPTHTPQASLPDAPPPLTASPSHDAPPLDPVPADAPRVLSPLPTSPTIASPPPISPARWRRRRAQSFTGASIYSEGTRHPRRYPPRRLPTSLLRPTTQDPLRTVSYFSSHSVPPPSSLQRDADYPALEPGVRENIEAHVSFYVGHHRMVGDSFMVGDLFWHTLHAETLAPMSAPPSARPPSRMFRSMSYSEHPQRVASTSSRRGGLVRSATVAPRVLDVPEEGNADARAEPRADEGTALPTKAPHPPGPPVVFPVQAQVVDRLEHAERQKDANGLCLADAAPITEPKTHTHDGAQQQTKPAPLDSAPPKRAQPTGLAPSQNTPTTQNTQPAPPKTEREAPLPLPPPVAGAEAPALAAPVPADAPTPAAQPRPVQRPPRLRPILRPSGSHPTVPGPESTPIESREGWDVTRERLATSVRSRSSQPARSRVMQALEEEMQVSMRRAGRGAPDVHEEHAALPRPSEARGAAEAPGARAASAPGAAPASAPASAPAEPRASAPAARAPSDAASDGGSLASMPADAASSVSSLQTMASARSSNASSVPPLVQAGETLFREPRALLSKLRPPSSAPSAPSVPSKRHVRIAPPPRLQRSAESLLSVHEEDLPSQLVACGEAVPVGAGDQAPPSPMQVLAREKEPPLPTGPARRLLVQRARERAEPLHTVMSPVLKRDRMLVKIQHAPHQTVSTSFDALEARKYDVRTSRWAEYMVALRPGRIELWSEATVRGRVFGNTSLLKLRHVVLLEKGTTSLSMYSDVDRLFCLSFPRSVYKASRTARTRFFRRSGSVILLFSARALTTTADWMWVLNRELGGAVPAHLYVHIPELSVRIRVPVPELPASGELGAGRAGDDEAADAEAGAADAASSAEQLACAQLTSAEVIRSVVRLVRVMPNWAQLAERMAASGIQPKLVWRAGSVYNWIHTDVTVDGRPRFWSVLVGRLFASHGTPPTLEMLGSVHYPTDAQHPNGARLTEPPGLEGVVWRLRAVSGAMSRVYVSTQASRLYLMRLSRAFPPDAHAGVPLDTAFETPAMTRAERVAQHSAAFHAREQARQQLQIRYCDGFVDLREVTAIRSVGTGITLSTDLSRTAADMAAQVHAGAPAGVGRANPQTHALYDYDGTRAQLDALLVFPAEDGGMGDAGLQQASDRAYVHALRQIDLLMANGRRVSIECASAALAREWIVRLYQLAIYWSCRQKTDAFVQTHAEQRTLTGSARGAAPADDASTRALRLLWNWCVMDGCRATRFSGRLFWKPEHSHNFQNRFFALCGGALVAFKLIKSMRSATSRQNEGVLYKRLEPPILLRDAYVYTGRISDRLAQSSKGDANATRRETFPTVGGTHLLPRLYPDGLTSLDDDDDCLFALRVRIGHDALSAQQNIFRLRHRRPLDTGEFIPGLADKMYGEILFRARSVLERDLWIRAIEVEIENLARTEPERERLVRERGHLV